MFVQVSSIGRLHFCRPVDLSRSISTVDADSPSMWIHIKKRSVDRVFPRSQKKTPLTCGPIGGEKWSRTHIHQKFMVPCVGRNGPNTYPNINIYPPICRTKNQKDPVDRCVLLCFMSRYWSRLISTVDDESLMGEYGRYRQSMLIHLR